MLLRLFFYQLLSRRLERRRYFVNRRERFYDTAAPIPRPYNAGPFFRPRNTPVLISKSANLIALGFADAALSPHRPRNA